MKRLLRVGGVVKQFIEGFMCDNLDYNPFRELILDMKNKRSEYKKAGLSILQEMCKKLSNGCFGTIIRCDSNETLKCVSENWMMTEYENSVKKRFLLKNGIYMVNITNHSGVDDNGKSKKKQILNHFNSDLVIYHIRKDK